MRYMAIDQDKNFHDKESQAWTGNGIQSIRVDTMCEGIKHAKREEFLFIAINADNIDYMSKLNQLKNITSSPILIATSNFTIEEHALALKNGADAFGLIGKPKSNVDSVYAILDNINSRSLRLETEESIVLHDLMIFPKTRKVLVNEREVFLSKLEMRVLCFLIKGNGRFHTSDQIAGYVYDDDKEIDSFDSIKNIIMKIRNKIGIEKIIITKWGKGYKIGEGYLLKSGGE